MSQDRPTATVGSEALSRIELAWCEFTGGHLSVAAFHQVVADALSDHWFPQSETGTNNEARANDPVTAEPDDSSASQSSAASPDGVQTAPYCEPSAPETPGTWEERCAALYQVIGAMASYSNMFQTSDDVANALDVAAGRGDVEKLLPWPKDLKAWTDLESRTGSATRTINKDGSVTVEGYRFPASLVSQTERQPMKVTDEMVDRFLSWPLPASVCSDLCVTTKDYPYQRFGTNLLTADEARKMLEYVLSGVQSASEPPSGYKLVCEKCGTDKGDKCGWPSNCPTGAAAD